MRLRARHCATLLGVAVMASSAHATTLWGVWQQASAHDPAFMESSARLQAAAQGQPEALAALLPHLDVTAGGELQNMRYVGSMFNSDSAGNLSIANDYSFTANLSTVSWGVTITQPLFDWSAFEKYGASKYEVAAAAARYQTEMAKLVVDVAKAYVKWRAQMAVLAALRMGEQGFAQQAKRTADAYHAGSTGIIGMDEAMVAYQDSRNQVYTATAALHSARYALEHYLGGLPASPAAQSLATATPLPPLGHLKHWLALARRGNPQLAQLAAQYRAAERNASAARGGYWPSLSAELGYAGVNQTGNALNEVAGQSFYGPGGYQQQGGSVGVTLTWHLFSGGDTNAKVDAAQAKTEEALAKLQDERLGLEETVRQRYDDFDYDRRRIEGEQSALRVAMRAVRAADEGAKAGVISENNAISDRQTMLQIQQDLIDDIAKAYGDYLALAQAAGMATPGTVRQLSAMLG